MHGPSVLSVLLTAVLTVAASAQVPSDAPPAPDLSQAGFPVASDVVPADQAPMPSMPTAECNKCNMRCQGHQRLRAPQASSLSVSCCGDYFGGFGPLWETYCADRHRRCGDQPTCPSKAPCASVVCQPPCAISVPVVFDGSRWHALRDRIHHAKCRITGAEGSCDCAACSDCGAAMTTEEGGQPNEVGAPPVPPSEAAEPSEPTNEVNLGVPNIQPPKSASSRRGWALRTLGWLPGK